MKLVMLVVYTFAAWGVVAALVWWTFALVSLTKFGLCELGMRSVCR